MKISIASDHGGFDLKEDLRAWLTGLGHEVVDFGCHGHDSCDYADFVEPAGPLRFVQRALERPDDPAAQRCQRAGPGGRDHRAADGAADRGGVSYL